MYKGRRGKKSHHLGSRKSKKIGNLWYYILKHEFWAVEITLIRICLQRAL